MIFRFLHMIELNKLSQEMKLRKRINLPTRSWGFGLNNANGLVLGGSSVTVITLDDLVLEVFNSTGNKDILIASSSSSSSSSPNERCFLGFS